MKTHRWMDEAKCSFCGRTNQSIVINDITDVVTISTILKGLGKNSKICTYCNSALQNNISKIKNGLTTKFSLEYKNWIPFSLVLKPEPYCVSSRNSETVSYIETLYQDEYSYKKLPFASKEHMNATQEISQKLNDEKEKRQDEDFCMRGGLTNFPSIAGFYIKDFSYPNFLTGIERDRQRRNELKEFSDSEHERIKNETLEKHSYMFNEAVNIFLSGRKAAVKRKIRQETKKLEEEKRWEPIAS